MLNFKRLNVLNSGSVCAIVRLPNDIVHIALCNSAIYYLICPIIIYTVEHIKRVVDIQISSD